MANTIAIRTKKITRDKLAKFLPNHEAIKAFEDMTHDIAITLPDAIDGSSFDASSVIAQAAFAPRAPVPSRPTAPDANQVMSTASFARPQPPAQPVNDATGMILAGQIFGA